MAGAANPIAGLVVSLVQFIVDVIGLFVEEKDALYNLKVTTESYA